MTEDTPEAIAAGQQPHESRQGRKRRWFKAGAAEFARTFPEIGAQIHGGRLAYACPLCAFVAPDGSFQVGLFEGRSCAVCGFGRKDRNQRQLQLYHHKHSMADGAGLRASISRQA